jgi:hypothetical protein
VSNSKRRYDSFSLLRILAVFFSKAVLKSATIPLKLNSKTGILFDLLQTHLKRDSNIDIVEG